MNLRLNLFLILLTLGLGGWAYYLYYQEIKGGFGDLIKRDDSAEYVGLGSQAVVYDLHGKPQYWIESPEIQRFEQDERTVFLQPKVVLFEALTGKKQWQLTATQAELTKEKKLYLQGGVQLESLLPHAQLQRLNTEYLGIDLTTYDIFSDREVKSQGQGFSTSGIGLNGNLKTEVATLQREVKTFLLPSLISSPSRQSAPKTNKD